MLNLMAKRYIFFTISLCIIVPGIIAMIVWGLPFSIDFRGGSSLEAQFASGTAPEPAKVIELYHSLGIPDARVFTGGQDILIIHSSLIPDADQAKVLTALSETFNDKVTARRFDNVGPTLAQEVAWRGVFAILVSSIILTIYITLVFRGVPNAFRYGVCTVIALMHDILLMLSVAAIGGHFFGWQIDTLFLTAILTVIAFSAQDTIVVFDRIRENSRIYRRLDYEKLVNHSVVQTLTRSINTQIMAIDFLLLALALFGGESLRVFALVLLVGMVSGSYSSGFDAAPLLIVWENQEWKTWFKRKPKSVEAV